MPTTHTNAGKWFTVVLLTGLALCAGCGAESASSPASSARLAPPTGEACVQLAFGELTAAQRAGQLVMAGLPIATPGGKSQQSLVSKNHLGGVFLAGRSTQSPAAVGSTLALLPPQRTAHSTIGLLRSVDQEGGKVQSLHGGSWITIPTAVAQGRLAPATLTTQTKAWVAQLKSAGLTMDLAPVADTVPAGSEQKNPPIGVYSRQYGSTSAAVSAAVTTVTTAMWQTGVIPAVKHFPGLGRVRYNTDTSTKAKDTKTTATDPYLRPFQAGINAGAGAVMISSASYPKLDSKHIAVFSSAVITKLLRGQLKYQGVVMTDDMSKAVAVKAVPKGQRATRFIAAGGDVVLAVTSKDAPTTTKAIAAKAKTSTAFRKQVNASVLRVLRLKQSAGLLTCS